MSRDETNRAGAQRRMNPPDATAVAVPSPCIGICRIDPASGLCAGCLRTLDEIAAWGTLDDTARRLVWNAIATRRASVRDVTQPDALPK